jgi:hypothetical protein
MREVIRTTSLILAVLLWVPTLHAADPAWEYVYEGDTLPDDTSLGADAWQLMGDNSFAEVTDQSELHIDDIGQNHCFFLYNVADSALMQQATIEARVKVLSQSGSADFEVLVGMQDGSNSQWLDLFPDHILLNNTGTTYDVDMTEYHVLRMVRDTEDIRIYVDDVEVISEPYVGAGESWIGFIFGAGCTACTSEQYWDYLAFTTQGGFSPDELPSYARIRGTPDLAYGPKPADGSLYPNTWANLSWRAGLSAVTHDVYLGEDFADVDDGTPGAPGFIGNQASTSLVVGFPGFPIPDGLAPGTTYYWRVDEVNEADPNSPWKGNVWSFSIPPKIAYLPDPVDGAGFVDPNATLNWTAGNGAKLHTFYIGDSYDDVDNATGGTTVGVANYTPGPLDIEKVYYWRVDEFDGIETYKGDIWAFTTPGAVGNPDPANGAVDVQMNTMLTWTAADNAASHELYFGTDTDAVKIATTASPEYVGPKALGAEGYNPGGLALDSSSAWRVDEVYPNETVKGLVWTFTTADFLLVDDFEAYNDIDPPDPASNRIFEKWIDGFGTTTNGALVGNDMPPYAEQTIVHGGGQSMIYRYDNANKTSEATLTLVWPRDWTAQGVAKLSLWIRGSAANAADGLFVALNGTAVINHNDASATQLEGWNEWIIDLAAFGVDLTNVNSISIGVGTKNVPSPAGGTGILYFDDIRLVP